MKKHIWKISIFMLLMSICACGFLSRNNKETAVYAATQTTQDCYYLLNETSDAYESNTKVGQVSGLGDFIVGKQDIEITATANTNFQLVGWQVTYKEQENRVEYYDVQEIDGSDKVVKLTPAGVTADEDKVDVTFSVVKAYGYNSAGTFKISRVFEDLTITPVFDHIYYNVNIDELTNITNHINSKAIGNVVNFESEDLDGDGKADTKVIKYDELFYNESETATTFSNAYIRTSYMHYANDNYINETDVHYYFFDLLYTDGSRYYTLHPTLTSDPIYEKIDYSRGAYRVTDKVNIALNVDIDESDVYKSKNIDFKGASINSNSTTILNKYDSQNPSDENYSFVQNTSWLRTESYEINFFISNSSTYVNTVDLTYHNLYVADIDLLVDGDSNHEDNEYILGDVKYDSRAKTFKSNVNIENFYSMINQDELMFLVKKASDNNSKEFSVGSILEVGKVVDGDRYSYFTFDSLSGSSNPACLFPNVSNDLKIEINYLSITQNIDFEFAELIEDSIGNKTITSLGVDSYTAFKLKRRDTINTAQFEAEVKKTQVLGYEYVGFVNSLDDAPSTLQTEFSFMVDAEKPVGKKVVLCFKKVSYNLILSNYNEVTIGSLVALESMTITKTNLNDTTKETLSSVGANPELKLNQHEIVLNTQIKLNDVIAFSKTVNTGFDVRFSLLDPTTIANLATIKTKDEMNNYFIGGFTFNIDLIANIKLKYEVFDDYANWETNWQNLYIYDSSKFEYVLNTNEIRDESEVYYTSYIDGEDNNITIYIYEEKIEYTITYQIDVHNDDGTPYVMADIDVETAKGDIKKFNLAGVETNSATDKISKIIISGLNFNDVVKLTSKGLPYSDSTYMFSSFIGRVGLEAIEETISGEVYYNYVETVKGTRTIDVLYTIPVATIIVGIDENFEDLANSPQDIRNLYTITSTAEITEVRENNFSVNIGSILNFEVVNIPFGYNFIGYQIGEEQVEDVDNFKFEHMATKGNNIITLKFERIVYHLYFAQFGENIEDANRYVQFNGNDFAELSVNINDPVLTFEKPLGYYVSNVRFGSKTNVLAGTNLYEGYSTELSENNDFRSNNDIVNYSFKLSKQQFISLVNPEDIQHYQGVTNDDGIVEVYVRIDYLVFTYEITVNFALENPKGVNNIRDTYVSYPLLQLSYKLNGETIVETNRYSTQQVKFELIPYGANNTQITVLSDIQAGLSVVGWRYNDTSNTMIDQMVYEHANTYIKLGTIIETKEFKYLFSYSEYKINLIYSNGQGNPSITVNGNVVNVLSNAKITLFDSLVIDANPSRSNGYNFDKITYQQVVYKKANVTEENWSSFKDRVYILSGIYTKNKAENFDETIDYYVREVSETIYDASSVLTIDPLIVDNFVFVNSTVTFNIYYSALELTVENIINESGIKYLLGSDPNNSGNGVHKLAFEKDDLVSIKIVDEKDPNRNVDTVTVEDSFVIYVNINNLAKNYYQDGKYDEYDLTKGLVLKLAQIGSLNPCYFEASENGEYSFRLNVKEYLTYSDNGDVIKIQYQFLVQKKNIRFTTNIDLPVEEDDDTTLNPSPRKKFYNKTTLCVSNNNGVDNYGYSFVPQDVTGKKYITADLNFLYKYSLYTIFLNDYASSFNISGVKIYETVLDYGEYKIPYGAEPIDPLLYDEYGIVVNITEKDGIKFCRVEARSILNIEVVFQVEPVLKFNFNNDDFSGFQRDFACSLEDVPVNPENPNSEKRKELVSVKQELTIGAIGASGNYDIQIASDLISAVRFKYFIDGKEVDFVENVGEYTVQIFFDVTGDYEWLKDIVINEELKLTIKRKVVSLNYYWKDSDYIYKLNQTSKEYDGKSEVRINNSILYALYFDFGNGLKVNYYNVLDSYSADKLRLDSAEGVMFSYISTGGKGGETSQANENLHYNLYIGNINFKDNDFNKNLRLLSNDLIISNYIQITRKSISLSGVNIYNKVYDGTNKAELVDSKTVGLVGVVSGDELILDATKLNMAFEDYSVGENKTVIITAGKALSGTAASNYKIATARITRLKIYPYSISPVDKQFSDIQLINKRGLTEKDKVNLIPLNAQLQVKPIYPNSSEYTNVYSKIQSYLKGNNEFAMGYQLILIVDGEEMTIDNNLYLSVPNVKDLIGAHYLTGSQTGTIEYVVEDGKIMIDLSQIEADVNTIFLTQKKVLLKPWQITLIVVIAVLAVAAVVLTFVILRRRKHKEYSVHEKI